MWESDQHKAAHLLQFLSEQAWAQGGGGHWREECSEDAFQGVKFLQRGSQQNQADPAPLQKVAGVEGERVVTLLGITRRGPPRQAQWVQASWCLEAQAGPTVV